MARPTFDDHFLLREEFNRIPSLTVEIAEETLPGTAEGKERHRRSHPQIDANVPDFGLIPELARVGATAGEETRLIAVRARIDQLDGRVKIVDMASAWSHPPSQGRRCACTRSDI